MAKTTVTGGAGFIGSNLAQRLITEGHEVTIFDNLSRSGGESNLRWLREQFGAEGFRFAHGDLRDFEALKRAIEGAERVYHLAGQVAVTTSVRDPRGDFEDNALGTFNALEAARLVGDDPIFLYSSTNKVYGGMEHIKIVEQETRYAYADYPLGIPETEPLDHHSPYGCCYSEDTEVLTRKRGWKRFYELTPDDEVLTYNLEQKVAEFQRPTAHFAYEYEGKMYVQNNRRLKTCVTPNHKMLVSWDCNHDELENPKLLEAESIAGKPMAYLLAAEVEGGLDFEQFVLPEIIPEKHKHHFPEKTIPMRDWLRFLGWYLSEGHCYESKKGGCTVTLTTYYRTEEAIEVMQAIGLNPCIDKHHVIAGSKQIHNYLQQFGKSHDKYIPQRIKELDKKHLVVLLQALLDGDGNRQGKNGHRYTTVSKQLADDVQEIAIKCGLAASVRLDSEGFYRVQMTTTRTVQCNLGKNRSEWVDYSGMVYCVEVPNSVVMVRQNGKAYFSGNSKGCGDQYTRDYHRIYGLRSVVMRQSAIYGYRQFGIEDQGWVAWFIIAALKERPITIYGDGKQVRDVLFITDLLDAYDAAVQQIDRSAGQIYNVGGGPAHNLSIWREFGPMLEELLGRPIPVTYGDWRPGDQPVYISDIRKIEQELGWTPKVGVREGVQRLFEWTQENQALFAHL